MPFLRIWLPVLIAAAGIVYGATRGFDETGLDAAAAMIGAGGALYLMNLLMRVGLSGDHERDREDEARDFYDRHGMWPDEVPEGWTPPEDRPAEDEPPRRPAPRRPRRPT